MPRRFQGERKFDNRSLRNTLPSRPPPQPQWACGRAEAPVRLFGSHRAVFCIPFAEPVSWWERPKPTPASQTSWKGEPSITVRGRPRDLRSASRYLLTTPVSSTCHSQQWARVSKNQSYPSVNSRFLPTHLGCLMGLGCGLCRFLEKSAF